MRKVETVARVAATHVLRFDVAHVAACVHAQGAGRGFVRGIAGASTGAVAVAVGVVLRGMHQVCEGAEMGASVRGVGQSVCWRRTRSRREREREIKEKEKEKEKARR